MHKAHRSGDLFQAWSVKYEVTGVWTNSVHEAFFEYEASARDFAERHCIKDQQVATRSVGSKRLINVAQVLCIHHMGSMYVIGKPIEFQTH